MSSPTETPSPLPTLVGNDAGNEERGADPGRVYNIAPMTIAIDSEGGISYVQRLMAQVGSGGPGEEVVLLINHQSQSTRLETPIHVSPNPKPPFLPDGIPIHDPLAFASQLAQHYSASQGQAPIPVAELTPYCEGA